MLVAVVLLMGRTDGVFAKAAVVAMLTVCLALTYAAMRLGEVLTLWLGKTGADVSGRIMGVLLASLAVQFIFDGLQVELSHVVAAAASS